MENYDLLNAIILLANFVIVPALSYGSQLALAALGITLVYAVLRFSGRANEQNFNKHSKILKNHLSKDNISIISSPIKATYNSPFILPVFRRNESMFLVEWNQIVN